MMASNSVRLAVHGLLALAMCMAAEAATSAAPVANDVHAWSIPAEDGEAAIRDFGLQSGVAISAAQQDIQGKRFNAVSGSLSVDNALRQLVAGTGLKYFYDQTGRAVTVAAASSGPGEHAVAPTAPANVRHGPSADPTDPSPRDTSLLVEEIVVTARKRQENLQDVPISADVISGQTLADSNLNSLAEMAQTTPGLQVNGTGAGGQLFIRGVGSGTSLTFDQSVGTFIDDIYHGRTRIADAAILDLDRVEILKGPQSTFFGNNAVAGAFNIVTAKPTDVFGGSVRALYGQYGQYAGEAMLNLPVTDALAVRIAAIDDGLSGWKKDPFAGHDQPDQSNKAGRVTFLLRPTDDFEATLKIEGGENRDTDGSQIGDCPPPAPFVASGFCKTALAAGYPTGVNDGANTTDAGQGTNLSTFEDVLTLNYHLGGQTLTSVTGFYNYHFQQDVDADGTPAQLLNLQTLEKYHQFSQELRIASPTGQILEYLGGLYFQNDQLNGHTGDLNYFFLTPTIEATKAYAPLLPYLPLAATAPNSGVYEQNEHSYAAFGSLGWNVTDQLKLSSGLRGSWVYKDANEVSYYGTATQPYGGIVPLPASLSTLAAKLLGAQTAPWTANRSDNALMPSAQIQYRFDPEVMLYLSYSRGFLAGIPTGGVVNGVATPQIQPEHVNAYEAGLKTEWFDQRLRLNMDIFRSDYTNLQVSSAVFNANNVPVGEITNAGRSRSQGVEFEGEWAVTEGFRLKSTVTYLDARYEDYPNVTLTAIQTFCRANPTLPACAQQFPGGVPVLQNLSGHPTSFAPTWSGTFGGAYSAALPGGYHFITEADVYASTSYFYGNNGTDDQEQMQTGYARLDGRFSLESPDSRWAVDVVLKNLTDRLIVGGGTGGTSLPTSTGSTLVQTEQPRNVALQARYKW
jgi:iron complex outermembrane recepter protein